jgi:hypothetical protein
LWALIGTHTAKFTAVLDAVFAGAGVRVISAPVRAPRANAIADRWVDSARPGCLDRVLITGERVPLQNCRMVFDLGLHEISSNLSTFRAC